MGIQDNFSTDTDVGSGVANTARATDSVNYITDLLGELQTIANLSGLTELSEDLVEVIAKHVSVTVRAA